MTGFDALSGYSRTAVGVEGHGINRRSHRLYFPRSDKCDIRIDSRIEIVSRTVQSPTLEVKTILGRSGRGSGLLTGFDALSGYSRTTVGIESYGVVSHGDGFPNSSHRRVCRNFNRCTGSLFNSANVPSLKLLSGRRGKGTSGKNVLAGNIAHRSHLAGTFPCSKGHRVGGGLRAPSNQHGRKSGQVKHNISIGNSRCGRLKSTGIVTIFKNVKNEELIFSGSTLKSTQRNRNLNTAYGIEIRVFPRVCFGIPNSSSDIEQPASGPGIIHHIKLLFQTIEHRGV